VRFFSARENRGFPINLQAKHSQVFKRSFDLLASFLGIVVLVVPFFVVALLVKISSPGPLFYCQKRVGRFGNLFTCVKFRTMYCGSDTLGSVTSAGDSRITPIGKFLRKFKLDEFPQLFNVLIGQMSFVGPRPDVPGYADKLSGDNRDILLLRPGITGPASIFFRNEEKLLAEQPDPKTYNDLVLWPAKVALNLAYLRNWSFWRDIGYILVTLFPWINRVLRLVEEK